MAFFYYLLSLIFNLNIGISSSFDKRTLWGTASDILSLGITNSKGLKNYKQSRYDLRFSFFQIKHNTIKNIQYLKGSSL